MNTALEGLVRAVLGERARELLPVDQVLEDADRRLRQRQEELHGPPGLDDGLDADQGLAGLLAADAARVTEGSPRGGALRSLSRFSWRRPGLEDARRRSRCPSPRSCSSTSRRSSALLIQGFWTTDSFTGKIVHSWNLDNFRDDRGRALPDDHPADAR